MKKEIFDFVTGKEDIQKSAIKKAKEVKNEIVSNINYTNRMYVNGNRETFYAKTDTLPFITGAGVNDKLKITKKVDTTGVKWMDNKLGTSALDIIDIKDNIKTVQKIVAGESSKSLILYDLETVGSRQKDFFTGANPTVLEREAFGVIEAYGEEVVYKNGKRTKVKDHNYIFGINEKQKTAIESILSKYNKGESLTSSELNTLETMAKIGTSVDLDEMTTGANLRIDSSGKVLYSPPETFNKKDTNKMRRGIDALFNLGKEGYLYNEGVSGNIGTKQMKDFLGFIEYGTKNDIVTGHNSKVFDESVLIGEALDYGFSFSPGNKHLDTYDVIKKLGIDMSLLYEGTEVSGGFNKLETQSRLNAFVENLQNIYGDIGKIAHTASYDTNMLANLFDVKMTSLKDKTFIEYVSSMIDQLESTRPYTNLENGQNFLAKRSLNFKTPKGNFTSVNTDNSGTTFDFVTESFIDSNGTKTKFVNDRKTSIFKSNNVYKFNGIEKINIDEFFEEFERVKDIISNKNSLSTDIDIQNYLGMQKLAYRLEEVKKSTGELPKDLYIGEFENKTSYGETSYMIRDSVDEIVSDMGASLVTTDLNQNQIETLRKEIVSKKRSRTIQEYYDNTDSVKSFKRLEDDFETYKRLKDFMNNENLIESLSEKDIRKLINDGKLSDKYIKDIEKKKYSKLVDIKETIKDKNIYINDLIEELDLNVGANRTGAKEYDIKWFNKEKLSRVLDNFGWFKDNDDLFEKVVSQIRNSSQNGMRYQTKYSISNIKPLSDNLDEDTINMINTIILKNVENDSFDFIKSNGGRVVFKDKNIQSNVGLTDSLILPINGKKEHINISNKDTIKEAIRNYAYRDQGGSARTLNSSKNDARILESVKKMADEMYVNGYIDKKTKKKINSINRKVDAIDALSSSLLDSMEDKIGNVLTDSEKINLGKTKKELTAQKREVSMSKNISAEERSKTLTQIEKKISAVDFIENNTLAGERKLDIGDEKAIENAIREREFYIVDKKGNKKGYNEFLKENGFLNSKSDSNNYYRSIAGSLKESELNKMMNGRDGLSSSVTIPLKKIKNKRDISPISDFFRSKVGLTSLESETVSGYILDTFLKKQKNGDQLAMTLFTKTDESKNLKTAHMIIASSSNQKLVHEVIASNTYQGNASMMAIELPVVKDVKEKGNVIGRLIGKNGNKKIVKDGFSVFYSGSTQKTKEAEAVAKMLNVRKTSSVDDVYKIFTYFGQNLDIFDELKKGHGDILSSDFSRQINAKLENLVGLSDATVYKNSAGRYVSEQILNLADKANLKSTSLEGLVDLLPAFWMEERSKPKSRFVEYMNKLWQDQSETSNKLRQKFESADSFFTNWFSDISGVGNKPGKTYGFSVLDGMGKGVFDNMPVMGFLKEAFIENAIVGEGFLEQIKNSKFISLASGHSKGQVRHGISYEDTFLEFINYLNDLSQKGSQSVSEKNVSKGIVTLAPVVATTGYGDGINASRPVSHSMGNNLMLNLGAVDTEYINAAKDHGIYFGEAFVQSPIDLEKTKKSKKLKFAINSIVENSDGLIMDKLTVNSRMLDLATNIDKVKQTRDIIERSVDIKEKLFEIFFKDSGITYAERTAEMEAKIAKVIHENLNTFENMSTFEQKSFASPLLSRVMELDVINKLKTDNLAEILIKQGDIVENGTVIGYDHSGREVKYKNGRKSEMIMIDDGKIILKRLDVVNSEQKYMSGSEKSVIGMLKYDTVNETLLAQELFELTYGKDVNIIANLELKKHTSPNYSMTNITDAAVMAFQDGSDEAVKYMSEKLLGVYGQEDLSEYGIKKGIVKTRYKDTNIQTSSIIVPSNYEPSKEVNTVQLYKNVNDSIMSDAISAKERVLNGSDDNLDKFLSNYYDYISTKDKEVYRTAIGATKVEKEYAIGGDLFSIDEDIVSGKTGKMGTKDLYWLGRHHANYSESAKNAYYRLDDAGNVIYSGGDLLREHFINMMESTDSYKKELGNFKKMIAATTIMNEEGFDFSSASIEDVELLENKLGLNVKSMSLEDAVLHGKGTTSENITGTVFGLDDSVDLIRLNLGESNILMQNTLSRNVITDANGNKFINRDSKYIYLANVTSDFVEASNGEGEMFITSKVQKIQQKIIDNLQRSSANSDNAKQFFEMAQKSLEEMWQQSIMAINEKDGIVVGKLYNQRLPFTGMSQYGDILSYEFDENLNHALTSYDKNLIIDLSKYNKDTDKGSRSVIDVKYVSEKHFKELSGSDDVFRDIASQLLDIDYNGEADFKNSLIADGILNSNGSINGEVTDDILASIGKKYVSDIGIQGIDTRYPSFNPNSQVAVMVRLKPETYGISSDSSIIHSHTALKLNADIDGDTGLTTLLLKRNKDRINFFEKGSNVSEGHSMMLIGQAFDNRDHWLEIAKINKEKTQMQNPKNMVNMSAEDYVKITDDITGGSGFFTGGVAAEKAYKAKYDKLAIGPISNPNFYANELAEYTFIRRGHNGAEFSKLQDILDFTSFTEQNIISAKLIEAMGISQIDRAKRYAQAMRSFTSGEDGVKNMTAVLDKMTFIDVEDINSYFADSGGIGFLKKGHRERNKLINEYVGTLSDKKAANAKTILKGIGTLNEMFNSDIAKSFAVDPFSMHNSINKDTSIAGALKIIEDLQDNKTAYSINTKDGGNYINSSNNFLRTLKERALGLDVSQLENIEKIDVRRQNIESLSKYSFVNSSGDVRSIGSQTYFSGSNEGTRSLIFESIDSNGNNFFHELNGTNAFENTKESIINFMRKDGFMDLNIPSSTISEFEIPVTHMTKYNDILRSFNERGLIDTDEFKIASDNVHKALIEKAQLAKANKQKVNSQELNERFKFIVNETFSSKTKNLSNQDVTIMFGDIGVKKGDSFSVDFDSNSGSLETFIINKESKERKILESKHQNTPKKTNVKSTSLNSENISEFKDVVSKLDRSYIINSETLIEEATARVNDMLQQVDFDVSEFEISKSVNSLTDAVKSQRVNNNYTFTKNVLDMYSKDKNALKEVMGWNVNLGELLSSGASTKDLLNISGRGIVSSGRYTGYKYSDLDFNMMSEVTDHLTKKIGNFVRGSNDIEINVLTDNFNSIEQYKEIIKRAGTDSSLETEALSALKNNNVKMAVSSELIDNVINSADGINIGEELSKYHDELLERAAKQRRAFENSIDGKLSKKGAAAKMAMVGAGIAVAGTMLAGMVGVAGDLDNNSKNNLGFIDKEGQGVAVLKRPSPTQRGGMFNGSVPMERRTSNIRAKGSSSIGDQNVINALKANYGSETVRVNITKENYDDDNNKWFEREMSGYFI